MSEMEFKKGKILPLGVSAETFLRGRGIVPDEGYSYVEQFYEMDWENDEKFMILHGKVYQVLDMVDLDPYGDVSITHNDDGTIEFSALWYNGGACLDEVIQDRLKKS
ncbi:hypothetical protein ZPAH1_orf00048 [Aeromonas phage ZPAH1]|nr:hypothetical protein ASwh1_2 [Aeromonas phage Aswh_1]QQG33810.1 hypothetical protein ZPAH1_orf00048 [Aeromonas phage ZPAH1]